jgi:regulator of cell morphogenesis and NO signaling
VTPVTENARREKNNGDMKTVSTEMTVGEIAARFPAAVRVFDQYHIDFCCGGGIGFEEACLARSLDPAEVLREVRRTTHSPESSPVNWETAPFSELIDHIVNSHHSYLKTQLPRIQGMLNHVLDQHSERHGDVLRPLFATFRRLKEELDTHLLREETVLFPLLRGLDGPETHPQFDRAAARGPIGVLATEHDSAGQALAEMRRLTANFRPPEDACNTYRALCQELGQMQDDLRRLVHIENNILFPRAIGPRR